MAPPAAAALATQRVRKCKVQLFHALQRRHRDAWRTYWASFQQYLMAQTSLEHFQAVAEQLLGPENIALHNTFIVALLQDCITYRPDPSAARGSENDNVAQVRARSEGEVEIKQEFPQRSDSPPDTESAELLIGLGRFVSH